MTVNVPIVLVLEVDVEDFHRLRTCLGYGIEQAQGLLHEKLSELVRGVLDDADDSADGLKLELDELEEPIPVVNIYTRHI